MAFLLDTMVLSETSKTKPDRDVIEWLASREPEELYVSVVSFAEIERGAAMLFKESPARSRILLTWLGELVFSYAERTIDVDTHIARRWGRLAANLGRRDEDVVIAATALAYGYTVVTRNVRHFEPCGVPVFNPY